MASFHAESSTMNIWSETMPTSVPSSFQNPIGQRAAPIFKSSPDHAQRAKITCPQPQEQERAFEREFNATFKKYAHWQAELDAHHARELFQAKLDYTQRIEGITHSRSVAATGPRRFLRKLQATEMGKTAMWLRSPYRKGIHAEQNLGMIELTESRREEFGLE